VAVFGEDGSMSQEESQAIQVGAILLAPEGVSGLSTIFVVDPSTTLDGNPAATFSVGDKLRVVAWEAHDTDADFEGELQALEVETTP
jgi:hypothetical protein